jgi:hypothetical protein
VVFILLVGGGGGGKECFACVGHFFVEMRKEQHSSVFQMDSVLYMVQVFLEVQQELHFFLCKQQANGF